MASVGVVDDGSGASIVKLAGSLAPLVPYRLVAFNALAITDTAAHQNLVSDAGLAKLRTRAIYVASTLNQAVSLNLVPYDPATGAPNGENSTQASVAAGSTAWIGGSYALTLANGNTWGTLGDYWPGLSITLSCSVAPASGSVTVVILGEQ